MLNTEYEELIKQSSSTWLSSQYPIKERVARWLKFYDARGESGLTDMFNEYRDRFLMEGTEVTKNWFVFVNEVREIVSKRAEAIPTKMVVSGADESLAVLAKELLGQPVYGDGRKFEQQQEAFNVYCEKTGNLILVLAEDKDSPYGFKVVRMPTGDVDVRYNSENIEEVWEYKFSWQSAYSDEKGNPAIANIEYYIDRERYKYVVNDEIVSETPHNLPFLPVVHVVNESIDNQVIGESVIESLIEPQLQINAVLSDIRMANRLGVYPVYYGTINAETFLFGPGSFTPVTDTAWIKRVENQTETKQLREELQGDYRILYRKGRVALKDEQEIKAFGNTPSGKALLVLNQDGIQYIESRVALLEAAWSEMLAKLSVIVKKVSPARYKKEGYKLFVVKYADLALEDPAQLTKEFEVVIKLHELGRISTLDMIQIGQKKGVLPMDWDAEEIIKRAGEESAAEELKQQARIAAARLEFQGSELKVEEEEEEEET